jgi:hypothetical protein
VPLLALPVLEEVLASRERGRLAECEHLPQGDAKGPNIAGVGVLALGEALQSQPLDWYIGGGLHHVVVVRRVARQTKVGDLHRFLRVQKGNILASYARGDQGPNPAIKNIWKTQC